ncbi:protein of unknown function [Friedmanniella luteola]|uniref:DUF4287 domain-containing protein n=1 Tax=Friedmanniella luteola TaxID=546871 RepID=A0A1H1TAT4_9ACTN|nr:DUF4287 domain-containing protein [Friedmanniella luteola]SDS57283.1 protein of unknown function [Friedmanniella luteola]
MSSQAYLDALEAKSGRTGPTTRAGEVVGWLAADYGVGRGHAMAFYGVLKNGPTVPEKHVGVSGTHRDESPTLRLDGVSHR